MKPKKAISLFLLKIVKNVGVNSDSIIDGVTRLYKIKNNMHQSAKFSLQNQEHSFKKGMTLQQYMASPVFEVRHEDSLDEAVEENLYQSSHYGKGESIYSKKRHYRIDQIDQESVQESKDYHNGESSRETPCFQQSAQVQDTLVDSTEPTNPLKGRANSISMSTAITFKHNPQEPNFLRGKRMSVSPHKKKQDVPFPNGSITLYGCKFGHQPPKQKQKMPQMLTFYGKLHLGGAQQTLSRKASIKQSDLKQKFKKKGQFQLNKALQYEQPSYKYGPHKKKQAYPDLRVEGHRDLVTERRNKFM